MIYVVVRSEQLFHRFLPSPWTIIHAEFLEYILKYKILDERDSLLDYSHHFKYILPINVPK